MSNSREKILSTIRKALTNKVPEPFESNVSGDNVFEISTTDLEVEFAENFTKLQGKFIYCTNFTEVVEQLNCIIESRNVENLFCEEVVLSTQLKSAGFNSFNNHDFFNCSAAITSCEALVSRTGSILLSNAVKVGRSTSVYCPIHICIAFTNQLVYDIKDGLGSIRNKYINNFPSLITLATGPSRTADIEKTLVVGVHGPKEVYCFLVDTY